MVKGKKSKVINEQHNINQDNDKTLPDDSSTTTSRQPLSLRYSNQFWKAFSKAKDNPDDSETSESSLIRSLFKNWYNSGLHFEEYITLMNYLASVYRGKYSPVIFLPDSDSHDDTTQRTFSLSVKTNEELVIAKRERSPERNVSDIFYKLILAWIVSEMPLNKYLSQSDNARKIHKVLKDELKNVMKDL